jgi:hypothetical protein
MQHETYLGCIDGVQCTSHVSRRPWTGLVISFQKEVAMNALNGIERVLDLGDALAETKQVSPTPPFYVDSTFGFGSRPNSSEDPP